MGMLGTGTGNERRVSDDQFAGIVKSFSVGTVSGLDGVSDTGVHCTAYSLWRLYMVPRSTS